MCDLNYSVDVCLRRSAKTGDLEEVKRLISKGALDINDAAINAASKGHKNVVDYLLSIDKDGDINRVDLFIYSGFSGDINLIKYLNIGDTNISNSSSLLLTTLRSGNKESIEFALNNGGKLNEYTSYMINPDNKSFYDIYKLFKNYINLELVYVAAANYSSVEGLKRVEAEILLNNNHIRVGTLMDAYIEAIRASNLEVINYLGELFESDNLEFYNRCYIAAAYSGNENIMMDIMNTDYQPTDEVINEAVRDATMRGRNNIIGMLVDDMKNNSLLQAYAAYSGNRETMRIVGNDNYEYIALGAARGCNFDILREYLDMIKRPDKEFLVELLNQAIRGGDKMMMKRVCKYVNKYSSTPTLIYNNITRIKKGDLLNIF